MNNKYELSFDIFEKYITIKNWIEGHREDNQIFIILEIGGRSEWLKEFLQNDKIYILDNENISDNPNFIMGDATELPFDDNSFDFIVSADVLEHIKDEKRELFIKEHYRCSKYGALIITPVYSNRAVTLENNINQNYKKLSKGEDYRWLLEHAINGLPRLEKINKIISQNKISANLVPLGSLPLWNFMLNLSHLIVFFNWQYPDVYEKFNKFNVMFNKEISKFDRVSQPSDSYRYVIYMFKNDKVYNKKIDNCYIDDINEENWDKFVTMFWDLIIELINKKDEEILRLNNIINKKDEEILRLNKILNIKD